MSKLITIAVDAMGGDSSPKKIIDGIAHHFDKNRNSFYQIFGDKNQINKFIPRSLSNDCYEIIHTNEVVKDDDTPLGAAKRGKNTSMWLAVESVKVKKADIVISAGNTGALLVIAKLNLKMIENIDKPALAGLWPNKNGTNIVLDLGASIDCSEKNLVDFGIMGSALFKALFPNEESRVAILNIGSEEIKGHEILKKAYEILNSNNNFNLKFNGYIEGNEIMDGISNVIITDGFTGNELKKTMSNSLVGKLSTLLNMNNFKKFKKRLDPRLYNGAIFIGLDSPVVKSHGGTDYIGFSNSLSVCDRVIRGNLIEKIKQNIS